MQSPLTQFLKRERGKQREIADALKIDRITLYRWARKGVPVTRVVEVSDLTGISRSDLIPAISMRPVHSPDPREVPASPEAA